MSDPAQAFKRVPILNENQQGEPDPAAGFKTQGWKWEDIERETKKFNEGRPKDQQIAEEVFAARLQLENQILQTKGQGVFYMGNYRNHQERLQAITKALEHYEELRKSLPQDEAEERLRHEYPVVAESFVPNKKTDIITHLKNLQRDEELSLLHAHEASASADARAKELQDQFERLDTVEHYGLDKTGEALSKLADQAMESLATRYAPPAIIVDERLNALYFRGVTSRFTGSTPKTLKVSTWLRRAMEPSSEAIPEPLRPANTIAVTTGPISEITAMETTRPV